jgi:uncharacterized phosphatase
MGTLFIVRHGQDIDSAAGVLNGRRDTRLTNLGRTQARVAAKQLRRYGLRTIYSSPLVRARETAKIIAEKNKIGKLFLNPMLIEREYGILAGKPIKDIPKYATETLNNSGTIYFLRAPGVERYPALYARARTFIRALKKRHKGESVLVVAHASIGKMLSAATRRLPWRDALKEPQFRHGEIIRLDF